MTYGVTGLPLAGKTAAARILEENGLKTVSMGDAVRKEREKRGLGAEKTGELVTGLREENGPDAVARLTAEHFDLNGETAVTGLRSPAERRFFEDRLEKDFKVIAVWSSRETRRKRMEKRSRPEDREGESLVERDRRELGFGLGKLVAESDYLSRNEQGLEHLESRVEEIIR